MDRVSNGYFAWKVFSSPDEDETVVFRTVKKNSYVFAHAVPKETVGQALVRFVMS
jgi:hypothetical protein